MASENYSRAKARFANQAAEAQIVVEATSLLQQAKALAASNKKPQAAGLVAQIRKLLSRLPRDHRDGRNLRNAADELAIRLIERGPLVEPHKATVKVDSDLVKGLANLASYKLDLPILEGKSGDRVKRVISNVLQTLIPFVKKAKSGNTIFQEWIQMYPTLITQERLIDDERKRVMAEDDAFRVSKGWTSESAIQRWIPSVQMDNTMKELNTLHNVIGMLRWTIRNSSYNRTIGGGKFVSSRPNAKIAMSVEDRFYFCNPKRFAKTPQSPRTSELLSAMKKLEADAEDAYAALKVARKNKKFNQCANACLSLIANYRRLESVYRDLHASAMYFARVRK